MECVYPLSDERHLTLIKLRCGTCVIDQALAQQVRFAECDATSQKLMLRRTRHQVLRPPQC